MSHDEKWSLFLSGLVWISCDVEQTLYNEHLSWSCLALRSKSSCVDIKDVEASMIQNYFEQICCYVYCVLNKNSMYNCLLYNFERGIYCVALQAFLNDLHPTVYAGTPSLLQYPYTRTLNVVFTIYSHAFISIGEVNTSAFVAACRSVWVFNQLYSIWKWFTVGKHSSHSVQRLHLIWHKINSV